MKAISRGWLLKGLLLVLLLSAGIYAAVELDMKLAVEKAVGVIRELGPWAFAAYVLLFAAAPLVLFPFAVIAVAGGLIFGFAGGWAAISAACTVSALLSFWLGRYFFRDAVHALVNRSARYKAVDDAVRREGWRIVALTRILPLFPFGPLNMFLGSTPIPLREYLLATWVFMLPGCALHAYLGAVGRELLVSGKAGRGPADIAFLVFTSAALIGGALYATKLARRALKSNLPLDGA